MTNQNPMHLAGHCYQWTIFLRMYNPITEEELVGYLGADLHTIISDPRSCGHGDLMLDDVMGFWPFHRCFEIIPELYWEGFRYSEILVEPSSDGY